MPLWLSFHGIVQQNLPFDRYFGEIRLPHEMSTEYLFCVIQKKEDIIKRCANVMKLLAVNGFALGVFLLKEFLSKIICYAC